MSFGFGLISQQMGPKRFLPQTSERLTDIGRWPTVPLWGVGDGSNGPRQGVGGGDGPAPLCWPRQMASALASWAVRHRPSFFASMNTRAARSARMFKRARSANVNLIDNRVSVSVYHSGHAELGAKGCP